MRIRTGWSARGVCAAFAATFVSAGAAAAQDSATKPKIDPIANCEDGGQPYRIGAHLCSSDHIVMICLSANQSYGVHGVYIYGARDKAGLHFDKAHWVSTTSARCPRADRGKVYY